MGDNHQTIRLAVIIMISAFLTIASYARNSFWRNETTLWAAVVFQSPNKAVPHINLGNAVLRNNQLEFAEKAYSAALNINPRDTRAINGLAVVYIKKKMYDEAIKMLEILAADKPDESGFHSNLGVVYMEKGLLDEAISKFNMAIKISPFFPDAYANLGLAYKKKGMYKRAKENLEKSLQLSPEHRDAKRTLDEVKVLLQRNSLNAARRNQ